jgi:cytochrome c oxidase assembly factor CtaG/putative copper export protein
MPETTVPIAAEPAAASESQSRLSSRGAALRWACLVALLTAAVLVSALVYGGSSPQEVPTGLPDPGALTGWGLPVVLLLVDVAAVSTLGLLLTGVFLLPSPQGRLAGLSLQAVRAAGVAAAAWAVLALLLLLLTVSDLLAVPLSETIQPRMLTSVGLDTVTGRATLAQSLLAVLVAASARFVLSTREGAALLGVAVVTVAPPVLAGHSAASGAHHLAVVTLLVHVVAASAWVGGLEGLAWIAWRGSKRFPAGLSRYSTLAAWCLALVAVSGVLNAAIRLEEPSALVDSRYGVLVLGKLAALLVLGWVGWLHRRGSVTRLAGIAADRGAHCGVRRAFVRLAGVELTIMGAAMALAVALSRTPTPTDSEAATDVSHLVGGALPPAPTIWRILTSVSPDGLGLLIVGLGAALYLQGLRVLRRRGDRWPPGRTAAWFTGLLLVAWSTFGGLGAYAHVLFSAHMVSHMVLSMVAPIFLVLAAPLTLALRTLPAARLPGEEGPRQLLLAVLHSRLSRVLTFPLVALAAFVTSLYALYFSSLFDVLMGSALGHAAMELHFLAVGCLFFYVLVGVDPGPRRPVPLVSLVLLLAAFALHALFAVALMAETRVLGESYYVLLDRPYRTDLLADQYLGAQISWALGELPLSLVLLAVFVQWVRGDQREASRLRRSEERHTASTDADRRPDEHEQYNAYLRRLAEREQSSRLR